MEKLISVLGLVVMMVAAWLISTNRRRVDFRVVIGGLFLQFLLGLVILQTPFGKSFFEGAQTAILALINLSDHGARFVFGENFANHPFAFKVLPTIIFVSSLSHVLFHLGILQKVVEALAWVLYRTMRVSGTESLAAAANVFLGQTEAPLLVRPYLKLMTRSELACMMTGGFATVAGGVLAAYAGMGISAGHLLSASLMSAPAAILISKLMFPEVDRPATTGTTRVAIDTDDVNVLDAACRGASEGLKLALNVGAMLIAFIALVALCNYLLGGISGWFGQIWTVEGIFGYLFAPVALIMGVPWEDALSVGTLLGQKVVLNEFIAYQSLGEMMTSGQLSERANVIATYALCGFANFSSIAIQIGGIGSIEPGRKKEFAQLGLKTLIGGNLAAFMTACIAGILS